MAMMAKSTAALELKRLRTQAGYSVRHLAAALRDAGSKYGQSPSSYAYYENDYKKSYLPVDLVDALVPLLLDRGTPPIGERQILALAGPARSSLWLIKPDFSENQGIKTKSEIETDALAEIFQCLEREIATLSLQLTGQQRALLVAEIYRRITTTGSTRRRGMVEWEVAHACRFAKGLLQTGH